MVLSVLTIGTVYHSSKTVKRQLGSKKWPLVYQSSHVYTESAKYTKPRKRRYLARPPSHVPGQWPQPVARGQGWLYVSTWTSMRLAPVLCRVLLHSLLPTDDACSSSSLSTTVIKFSIDTIMKAILFVILNVSVYFLRKSVWVEILILRGVWGGWTKKIFQARYCSP